MGGCGLHIICFRWDAAKCVASWVPDTDDLVEKAQKNDTFIGVNMHVFCILIYACFLVYIYKYYMICVFLGDVHPSAGSKLQRGVMT